MILIDSVTLSVTHTASSPSSSAYAYRDAKICVFTLRANRDLAVVVLADTIFLANWHWQGSASYQCHFPRKPYSYTEQGTDPLRFYELVKVLGVMWRLAVQNVPLDGLQSTNTLEPQLLELSTLLRFVMHFYGIHLTKKNRFREGVAPAWPDITITV